MKWKWLNSSGRARSQTASSQIPEVWALGSPQHVLFNKHPHTWPFTPAVPSRPQCLELSTVALAPRSLGSLSLPIPGWLGWAPHMVILLVRVENLRHGFLHLASLQSFLVLEAHATSSWRGAQARALAYQKSVLTELDWPLATLLLSPRWEKPELSQVSSLPWAC